MAKSHLDKTLTALAGEFLVAGHLCLKAKAQKSLFGSLGIHLDSHHIWDEHHLEACPSISGGKDWRFPVIP